MRFYAENAMLESSTPSYDDMRVRMWAAWCGHARVITRLLADSRAKKHAMTNCKGSGGVPRRQLCPMEVAHDKWGGKSNAFVDFGHFLKLGGDLMPER